MAADVVVEIDVHVFTQCGPFADVVGLAAQGIIGIRAAVECVPLRAV